MLVSDVVRRVRDAAGDTAALQFSQATLTDWINDGVRECVVENSLLQARATTVTVAGTSEYSLPEDIYKIHSVTVDGYKLDILTLQQWEEFNAAQHGADEVTDDTQWNCYIYAGVLTLWPTPTSELTLTINYTKVPAEIAYSASPEGWSPETLSIPQAFHNHVVVYCLAQVALQDDDFNKYSLLMQQFRSGVIDLKHVKDTEDDLYPFMSVSIRDSGELFPTEWY